MRFNPDGLNKTERRNPRIIVSLTSYPARINMVPYAIASLLNQTMKPDKIILWLGEEQFPGEKLPAIFERVKKSGVEVNFRADLRAHKKYFYAVKEYPEDIIITFDDDIIYDDNLIETLYSSYVRHPECVSAMRVHRINFDADGSIASYSDWDMESGQKDYESHQYLATGVGGVLYPPHSLHEEVFNVEALKKLCLMNDDIWLKFMEVMNGTKVVPAVDKRMIVGDMIFNSQVTALWKSNVTGGGNDTQIKAVLDEYNARPEGKTLLEIIRED